MGEEWELEEYLERRYELKVSELIQHKGKGIRKPGELRHHRGEREKPEGERTSNTECGSSSDGSDPGAVPELIRWIVRGYEKRTFSL